MHAHTGLPLGYSYIQLSIHCLFAFPLFSLFSTPLPRCLLGASFLASPPKSDTAVENFLARTWQKSWNEVWMTCCHRFPLLFRTGHYLQCHDLFFFPLLLPFLPSKRMFVLSMFVFSPSICQCTSGPSGSIYTLSLSLWLFWLARCGALRRAQALI